MPRPGMKACLQPPSLRILTALRAPWLTPPLSIGVKLQTGRRPEDRKFIVRALLNKTRYLPVWNTVNIGVAWQKLHLPIFPFQPGPSQEDRTTMLAVEHLQDPFTASFRIDQLGI
ncbi:MAG: hypothetical protein ABIH46_12985 [Chloroflexota bacterium]